MVYVVRVIFSSREAHFLALRKLPSCVLFTSNCSLNPLCYFNPEQKTRLVGKPQKEKPAIYMDSRWNHADGLGSSVGGASIPFPGLQLERPTTRTPSTQHIRVVSTKIELQNEMCLCRSTPLSKKTIFKTAWFAVSCISLNKSDIYLKSN